MKAVLYVHGKGGCAGESAHYEPLFPDRAVIGLAYRSVTPWEAGPEIRAATEKIKTEYETVTLIANSIGAYFCLHAAIDALIEKAYFISPVVDMERLISDLSARAGVTEADLREKGEIRTASGETLSWDYLSYVRTHPIRWDAPTAVLYGGKDSLVPYETVAAFAKKHAAAVTVMETGAHWFHTPEQMRFLDDWIRGN